MWPRPALQIFILAPPLWKKLRPAHPCRIRMANPCANTCNEYQNPHDHDCFGLINHVSSLLIQSPGIEDKWACKFWFSWTVGTGEKSGEIWTENVEEIGLWNQGRGEANSNRRICNRKHQYYKNKQFNVTTISQLLLSIQCLSIWLSLWWIRNVSIYEIIALTKIRACIPHKQHTKVSW